jgi:soluble lytic murein transglycosylase-like protein
LKIPLKITFLALAGLILAATLGWSLYRRTELHTNGPDREDAAEAPVSSSWSVRENAMYTAEILESMGRPDRILDYYRDEISRGEVRAFFAALVQSEEIASLILINADRFDIPPSLAFALCWGESRFNPLAVNRANQNRTVDRGLFQLNNLAFPKLGEEDFFDPAVNAYYGMAHLRWCLDSGGTEVAGLAMYNAGPTRVRAGSVPRHTLDHVSRILEFRNGIEALFQIEYVQRLPPPQREALIARAAP